MYYEITFDRILIPQNPSFPLKIMTELVGITIHDDELQILDRRNSSDVKKISCSEASKEELIEYLWYLNIEPPNKNIARAIKYNIRTMNYDTVKLNVRRTFEDYDANLLSRKQVIFLYAWNHYSHDELCEYLKQGLETLGLLNIPEISSLSLEENKESNVITNSREPIIVIFPTISYSIDVNTIDSDLIRIIVQDNPTLTEINLELYGSEFQWIIEQDFPSNVDPERVFQILNYFGSVQLRETFLQEIKTKTFDRVKQELVNDLEAFYEEHSDRVNWNGISMNPTLSEDFFKRHLGEISWNHLIANKHISETFFERYVSTLTGESLRDVDDFSWMGLSANLTISEAFVEKYIDRINWTMLSGNPSISEAFFEKHVNRIDWSRLSKNPALSEAFFEKYIDRIDWSRLSENPALSEAFFERHLRDVDWSRLSENPALSEAFFEHHLADVDWSGLSGNPALSEAFFERHLTDVDWIELSGNPALSEAFFERHLEDVDWSILSINSTLTTNFIRQHFDKFRGYEIFRNPSIPIEFVEQNIDRVHWSVLSMRDISDQLVWRTIKEKQYYSFTRIMCQNGCS